MREEILGTWVRSISIIALASVGVACSANVAEPQGEASSTTSALEVVVSPPPDINCLDLVLVDASGNKSSYPVAVQTSMVFRNIPVGAYLATAFAYRAADCSVVPLNAPWGTPAPANVIIQAGVRTTVSLRLVELGRMLVSVQFTETPQVIAWDQGELGTMAAAGSRLAWYTSPSDGSPSTVSAFTDTGATSDRPTVIATNQISTVDINVEPSSGDVYWSNRASGATDASGNPISDGSVWRYQVATGAAAIAPAVAPVEIGASASGVYWGDEVLNQMSRFDPSTSTVSAFIAGQDAPNCTALVPPDAPSQLLWTTFSDRTVRFVQLPGTTPIDVHVPPAGDNHLPIYLAGDGTYAYWTDFDLVAHDTRLVRAPLTGGPLEVLYPKAGDPPVSLANIEVAGGFVYVVTAGALRRMPSDGSGPLEVVQEGKPTGLAVTAQAGALVLYWTDANFGGVVWRAKLQ